MRMDFGNVIVLDGNRQRQWDGYLLLLLKMLQPRGGRLWIRSMLPISDMMRTVARPSRGKCRVMCIIDTSKVLVPRSYFGILGVRLAIFDSRM